MSTPFSPTTSVDQAAATPPAASADTTTATPVTQPETSPASTPTVAGAAPGAPQSPDGQRPAQQAESVGLVNLRAQYKALEADLGRYKPAYETLEKHGGVERVAPAVELYHDMSVMNPEEFNPGGVLGKLYDAHPDNFSRMLFFAVENIPELRDYVISKYAQNGQTPAPSTPGAPATTPEDYQYDYTDPAQAALKQRYDALQAEYSKLNKEVSTIKEQSTRTLQERQQAERQQRVESEVHEPLRGVVNPALAQLTGYADTDIQKIYNDIGASLNADPNYQRLYKDACDAAAIGARGALLDIKPKLRDIVAQHTKSSIEYFTGRIFNGHQAAQQKRDAQGAVREIPNTGAAAPLQGKQYKPGLTDPEFINDLTADIERQYGNRR